MYPPRVTHDGVKRLSSIYVILSSSSRGLPTRCPQANVHRCPRHYQSLALLGSAGITTRIPEAKDSALKAFWEQSEHWPVVDEHATSITYSDARALGFHNFCPEVAFDVFHLFASYLHRFSDEIDQDSQHEILAARTSPHADWRWNWQSLEPMHYTDCPVYSMLTVHETKHELPEKKDIVQLKPTFYGMSVDLIALWKRFSVIALSRKLLARIRGKS